VREGGEVSTGDRLGGSEEFCEDNRVPLGSFGTRTI